MDRKIMRMDEMWLRITQLEYDDLSPGDFKKEVNRLQCYGPIVARIFDEETGQNPCLYDPLKKIEILLSLSYPYS